MMVRRHLTERLRDPGSDGVFCAPPSPPRRVLGGGDPVGTTTTRNGWPAACRPQKTGSSWLRRCAGRRHHCCRRGETGEGARRLVEALAGVRRTSIEAGRYKAGWTRLSAGGRKRRAKASAAGTGTGSQGQGANPGAAGDGDAWGPDDRAADAPPLRFGEGGLSSRPQAIIAYPWTAMAQTVGTEVEE
jgi:hypothetical protein